METSISPRNGQWYTRGIALVGASAIVMAPISPIAPASLAGEARAATAVVSSEFHLTAFELPYILTLPIVRQQIRNWAETWAVYLAGLAKSGVGAAQSLLAIPGVTVEVVQQVLALDFVGAFDTLTAATRDAVIAVGQPLLDSLIWRNQKTYAVQTALQAAVPQAFIDVVNGFLVAGNGVTTSLIEGTQGLIAAVLTLNLGNIINAAIDGTRNFVVALGAGAGAVVSGIESAQFGITQALATEPPAAAVADVSGLRTLSLERTVSIAGSSNADTPAPVGDVATAFAKAPAESEPVEKTEELVAPQEHSPTAQDQIVEDAKHDVTAPGDLPTKTVTPVSTEDVTKDAPKTPANEIPAKVTAGSPEKETGTKDPVAKDPVAKDAGAKESGAKDAGAKPSSGDGGSE